MKDIHKGGAHSVWLHDKVVDFIMENGNEVEFRFKDGSSARFDWVDDNGQQIKGKLRCKSLGTHIQAKVARLGVKCQ